MDTLAATLMFEGIKIRTFQSYLKLSQLTDNLNNQSPLPKMAQAKPNEDLNDLAKISKGIQKEVLGLYSDINDYLKILIKNNRQLLTIDIIKLSKSMYRMAWKQFSNNSDTKKMSKGEVRKAWRKYKKNCEWIHYINDLHKLMEV